MEKEKAVLTPTEKEQWLWLRSEGYTLDSAWDLMKEYNPRLRELAHPGRGMK